MAFFAILVVVYELGALASVAVYAYRAGGTPVAYVTAFLHPPSRRNGIPWAIRSFGKAVAWPLVLYTWNDAGRPPSPVLFGEAAAEKLGKDPDLAQGFATKWSALGGGTGRIPQPARPAPRPAPSQRGPRDAVLRQLGIMREEIRRNDVEHTGLVNRPRYNKAFSTLVSMGNPAVPTLLEVLDHLGDEDRDSPEHWVAVFAVDIIGRIGDPAAVPLLQALLGQPYGNVEMALGRMREPGVRALLAALNHDDDFVRKQGAAGLGASTVLQGEVLRALVKGLRDPSAGVREASAASLARLGNTRPEVLDALRTVAQEDGVDWVRQMAERSLRELIRQPG